MKAARVAAFLGLVLGLNLWTAPSVSAREEETITLRPEVVSSADVTDERIGADYFYEFAFPIWVFCDDRGDRARNWCFGWRSKSGFLQGSHLAYQQYAVRFPLPDFHQYRNPTVTHADLSFREAVIQLQGTETPCVRNVGWLVSVHLQDEDGSGWYHHGLGAFPIVKIDNLRRTERDPEDDGPGRIVWFDLTAAIESIRTGAHQLPYEGFVLAAGEGITGILDSVPDGEAACVSMLTDAKIEVTVSYDVPVADPFGPVPAPGPNVARVAVPLPDLVLSKDRVTVKGTSPDSTTDCDPGPNQISAPAKNEGLGAAGPFTVQLLLDGEPRAERTVDGLGPGQEKVVVFDKVDIADGQHKLKLITKLSGQDADADSAVEILLQCQPETRKTPG